jgi:hypothetical protein
VIDQLIQVARAVIEGTEYLRLQTGRHGSDRKGREAQTPLRPGLQGHLHVKVTPKMPPKMLMIFCPLTLYGFYGFVLTDFEVTLGS